MYLNDPPRFALPDDEERIDVMGESLECDFIRECNTKGAKDTTDIDGMRMNHSTKVQYDPTLAEVMFDYIDLPSGPTMDEVLQFVLEQHRAGNKAAKQIIGKLAKAYADYTLEQA